MDEVQIRFLAMQYATSLLAGSNPDLAKFMLYASFIEHYLRGTPMVQPEVKDNVTPLKPVV